MKNKPRRLYKSIKIGALAKTARILRILKIKFKRSNFNLKKHLLKSLIAFLKLIQIQLRSLHLCKKDLQSIAVCSPKKKLLNSISKSQIILKSKWMR